ECQHLGRGNLISYLKNSLKCILIFCWNFGVLFDLHFSWYPYHSVVMGLGVFCFYIKTDHIEEVAKKAGEAGGVLKTEVFENHWDGKELLVEDPNGYKFAFYQK
ncbi:MAG: VOC family protein, partial [Bacteroidota bacterium]